MAGPIIGIIEGVSGHPEYRMASPVNLCLRQCWNQIEIDEETPRVGSVLEELRLRNHTDKAMWDSLDSGKRHMAGQIMEAD